MSEAESLNFAISILENYYGTESAVSILETYIAVELGE